MDADIVDVDKSKTEWDSRRAALSAIFSPPDLEAIDDRLGDLDAVIANEYFVHEAGHFLGVDVLQKYASGYFTARGRTLWPLVYAEEYRADLGSFEFALQLLPPADAERIFLYNLALRFGAHRKGIEDGIEVYGLVPYLLFCTLSELGFLSVEAGRIRIDSFESTRLREVMTLAARHVHEELTSLELYDMPPTDLAINVATYVRKRVDDRERRAMFASIEGKRGH